MRRQPRVPGAPLAAVAYAGQIVAAWLVFRDDTRRGEYDVPAFVSYVMQLWLSGVWVLLFLGLRRPAFALADACVLWLAVALTIREFSRKHRVAAALVAPYLAWVTYVTAVNARMCWRDR